MRVLFLLGSLVALLLVASACGDEEREPGQESAGATPTVGPSPSPGVEGTAADLQLRLELAKTAYHQGEPIMMTFTVANIGDKPLTLFFRDGQRYDFFVICGPMAHCPAPIWQWSHDKAFIQVLGQETIAPGQSLAYREIWDQKDNDGQLVPPDTYQAYATLVGCLDDAFKRCEALVSDVLPFEVLP